ncbi:MAG: RNA polymerase subunit sigma [Draconibacterium sp.]|nr:MAG: RNA polymerase subunit sigma [Draconibacterium sp.]
MNSNDRDLISRLKDSSTAECAFQELVEKYQERLYWHIRRIVLSHYDADDVLQNTFVKIWRNIGNFREESGLYTWLYRIATNESITHINSARKRNFVPTTDAGEILMKNLVSDPYFEGDEIQKKLQMAILQLPDKQRIVFNMKYFDDLKYEEISKILDTSVGALKASFHHATKKIEAFLLKTD